MPELSCTVCGIVIPYTLERDHEGPVARGLLPDGEVVLGYGGTDDEAVADMRSWVEEAAAFAASDLADWPAVVAACSKPAIAPR